MSGFPRARADVVHGDELCIRDPGGDDRIEIGYEDDHSPPADPDGLDHMLAPVAQTLLDAADLGAGERVLDVGCGCGAVTLAAGHRVGSDGAVAGIDITPGMLEIARARLARSGLTNTNFVEADAQTYPFTARHDVAISRFGTMFFDDPVCAFTNIRTALRPGGRLCVATWQPLEANAWLVVPGAAMLRWITLPDFSRGGPGMFAQADPAVIVRTLRDAGYDGIDVTPVKLALPVGSDPADAADRLAGTGAGRAVLEVLADDTRQAALSAVRAALADHADADGVRLGAAIFITSATARD